MSEYVAYDPSLFELRRFPTADSSLDDFLGVLDPSTEPWTYEVIQAASVSFTSGYTPDENDTLIVDADTVAISQSFWDNGELGLFPGNRISIAYDDRTIMRAIIDSATVTYSVDPEAKWHGATRRVDVSATGVGIHAAMMAKEVTWENLPEEGAIARIRRWVTVSNWTASGGQA